MNIVICSINDFDDNFYEYYYHTLNSYEKCKNDKYIKEADKKRNLLGLYIINNYLLDCDYKLLYNDNGKPYQENNSIYFNISHKDNYVVGVRSKKKIGIDIERIRSVSNSFIKQIANSYEQEVFKDNPILLFSLKEAYIKMKGGNISELLNVSFKCNKKRIICSDSLVRFNIIEDYYPYIIVVCEAV